jgi:hypothetical protein
MKPVVASLLLLASSAEAFVPCSMSAPAPQQAVVSRKTFVTTAAASIAAVAAAPAFAEPDVATAEATAEATEVEEVKRASTRLGMAFILIQLHVSSGDATISLCPAIDCISIVYGCFVFTTTAVSVQYRIDYIFFNNTTIRQQLATFSCKVVGWL